MSHSESLSKVNTKQANKNKKGCLITPFIILIMVVGLLYNIDPVMSFLVLYFGIAAIIAFQIISRRSLRKKLEKGNEQIKEKYPKAYAKFVHVNGMPSNIDRLRTIVERSEVLWAAEEEIIIGKEKRIHDELVSSASVWERTNGMRYSYLFSYSPADYELEDSEEPPASDQEREKRQLVRNFRNDPDSGVSEEEHTAALVALLPTLKEHLEKTFGKKNLHFLTLVCLPASTEVKNQARYEEFSRRLCNMTGMENGYSHLDYIKDGRNKKDPTIKRRCSGYSIQPEVKPDNWFNGKCVLLFDDVIIKGMTMIRNKRLIERQGADVIGGFAIGKTRLD